MMGCLLFVVHSRSIRLLHKKNFTETLRDDSIHPLRETWNAWWLCPKTYSTQSSQSFKLPHLLPLSISTTIKRYVLYLEIHQFFSYHSKLPERSILESWVYSLLNETPQQTGHKIGSQERDTCHRTTNLWALMEY